MIAINVSQSDIEFAKNQIEEFKKIEAGSWRYSGVEAWRGIVCEMLASRWLSEKYEVQEEATGLLPTGIEDDYDLIVNNKKIEIKSATKNYFRSIMPKIYDVNNHPKDIYIGVKYNETVEPNQIQIIGYMDRKSILNYPVEQNKGAPYYNIPIVDLIPIENLEV